MSRLQPQVHFFHLWFLWCAWNILDRGQTYFCMATFLHKTQSMNLTLNLLVTVWPREIVATFYIEKILKFKPYILYETFMLNLKFIRRQYFDLLFAKKWPFSELNKDVPFADIVKGWRAVVTFTNYGDFLVHHQTVWRDRSWPLLSSSG